MTPEKTEDKQPSPKKSVVRQPEAGQTTDIRVSRGKTKSIELDREWLESKSTEELISLMIEIALEIKVRARETEKIPPADMPLSFRDVKDAEVREFTRLPAASKKKPDEVAKTTWRMVWISSRRDHELLSLEVYDDVILGRAVPEGLKPDIDLTKFDGEELGVSRQHATLRPTKDELILLDLGSRNGTFCNATPVKLGAPQKVKDGDTVSFGGLHFKVQIVSQPA